MRLSRALVTLTRGHRFGSESRAASRKQVKESARIVLPPATSLPCVVRDISSTGAKIEIGRQVFLPREFTFSIPSSNMQVRARLRWRRGDHVGIAFAR